MERTQAFATLRLDVTADGQAVSDAYWRLIRQAQAALASNPDRRDEIDHLNEAYTTLTHVEARNVSAPLRRPQPVGAQGSGIGWLDTFVDWVAGEALRTRQRWPRRNPEIALIGGGATVLMFAAIGAGASLIAVFIAMAVLLIAIWAPWRRVE